MVHFKYVCHFWGEEFSPALAKKKTKLLFDEAEEVGHIGSVGKYRNKPQPYGSAIIRVPSNLKHDKKVAWLVKQIQPNLPALRECGATDIHIHADIFHDGQCNLEFDAAELKLLSDCGLAFTISVYEDEELFRNRQNLTACS
jgi:hypothetical protein